MADMQAELKRLGDLVAAIQENLDETPSREARIDPGSAIRFVVVRAVNADTNPQKILVQNLNGATDSEGVLSVTAVGDAFLAYVYPLSHPDEYRRFLWLPDPALGMVAAPYIQAVGFSKKVVQPFDLWDPFRVEPVDLVETNCFPAPDQTYITG